MDVVDCCASGACPHEDCQPREEPVLQHNRLVCPPDCAVGREASMSKLRAAYAVLAAAAGAHPNVHFFDPHDLYCQHGSCGPYIPGTSLLAWLDNDHLSGLGAFSAWLPICTFLAEHVEAFAEKAGAR